MHSDAISENYDTYCNSYFYLIADLRIFRLCIVIQQIKKCGLRVTFNCFADVCNEEHDETSCDGNALTGFAHGRWLYLSIV